MIFDLFKKTANPSVSFQQQRRQYWEQRGDSTRAVPSRGIDGFLDTARDTDSGCVSEPVPYQPTEKQQARIDRRQNKMVADLRKTRASAH